MVKLSDTGAVCAVGSFGIKSFFGREGGSRNDSGRPMARGEVLAVGGRRVGPPSSKSHVFRFVKCRSQFRQSGRRSSHCFTDQRGLGRPSCSKWSAYFNFALLACFVVS